MGKITVLEKVKVNIPRKHEEIEAEWWVSIDKDGKSFIQIDTFGSKQRKIKGAKSQTMRFNKEIAIQLKKILQENFPE